MSHLKTQRKLLATDSTKGPGWRYQPFIIHPHVVKRIPEQCHAIAFICGTFNLLSLLSLEKMGLSFNRACTLKVECGILLSTK